MLGTELEGHCDSYSFGYLWAMSLAELEKAISTLPPKELSEFSSWFEDYIAEQWEKKFEADAVAGKLDHLARKADKDFEAGRCSDL